VDCGQIPYGAMLPNSLDNLSSNVRDSHTDRWVGDVVIQAGFKARSRWLTSILDTSQR